MLVMQCKFVFPLFFFHWLHFGLEHMFYLFSIFSGWFNFPLLKLWHCYFPFELSSILSYWIFGFRSFMFKHLLWILPFFMCFGKWLVTDQSIDRSIDYYHHKHHHHHYHYYRYHYYCYYYYYYYYYYCVIPSSSGIFWVFSAMSQQLPAA